CEILNEDGTMARMPDLEAIAEEHNLLIVTVADMIEYRMARETMVKKVAEAPFPNEYGEDWILHCYRDTVDHGEHFVFTLSDVSGAVCPVLRLVQLQCTIDDGFRGIDCHRGWQLNGSIEMIIKEGLGNMINRYKKKHSRF